LACDGVCRGGKPPVDVQILLRLRMYLLMLLGDVIAISAGF
jgi:hypothetical protein